MASISDSNTSVETWKGSCHCGKVRFTVSIQGSIYEQETTVCNCECFFLKNNRLASLPFAQIRYCPFKPNLLSRHSLLELLLRNATALPLSLPIFSVSIFCSPTTPFSVHLFCTRTFGIPAYKTQKTPHVFFFAQIQVPSANVTATCLSTRRIPTSPGTPAGRC